jgi:hypothetical protein
LHGVIFASFRDFATRAYGRALAEALFADEPPYLLSEAYDDERFFGLVRRAAAEAGVDQDQLEVEFGIFHRRDDVRRSLSGLLLSLPIGARLPPGRRVANPRARAGDGAERGSATAGRVAAR